MTEDEFRRMCVLHDLTYDFSDDHSVWRRGGESLTKVKTAAAELPRETAVRIWNEVVDTKLREEYRQQFYWKV